MYTSLNNPAVEDSLDKQLAVIVREIVATYGSDCTIILAGGFGRGEGSVRILDGKGTVPLHDFDIYTVTNRTIDPKIHAVMEERIYREVSKAIGVELSPGKFAVGVEVIPSKSLSRLPPDISTFELKAASTLLHGPDVRPLIPWSSKDVSLASGAITLFHRTTALLKNVEPEFLEARLYPEDRILEAVYECCKVYTEICTALSLLGGFYYPSYRERAGRFSRYFETFPELKEAIYDLPEKISRYTEMKLKSDFSSIVGRPAEEWVQARDDLELCLRFFVSKMFQLNYDETWSEMCRMLEGKFKKKFFRDFLASYLARYKLAEPPLVRAVNVLFQAYDYHSFKKRVGEQGGVPPKPLVSFTSPLQNIYLASGSVLFSLADHGRIDGILLGLGEEYLTRIFGSERPKLDAVDSWKRARDDCVTAQRVYFIRQQKRTV